MGTSTFSGPVRSEAGFSDISTNATTGTVTVNKTTTVSTMTAGSGITSGVGTVYNGTVTKTVTPDVTDYYTRIFIDLTGLNDGGTTLDIIGAPTASANCHFGQFTAAQHGITYIGKLTCLEAPLTGGADIDLYTATEATGVEDTLVTDLTETVLLDADPSTLNKVDTITVIPAANSYLYLAGVTGSNATYTAGKFLIEFWGHSV